MWISFRLLCIMAGAMEFAPRVKNSLCDDRRQKHLWRYRCALKVTLKAKRNQMRKTI